MRSGLFFGHVRAATGGGIARHNCHPFRHGKWLFMHNGQIGGYAGVRRALEAQLPERLYAARRGATDSELLFLLALARIETGVPPADAMQAVLHDTQARMAMLGIAEPLRFAAALSDGQQLLAFRFASDDQPPSLYVGRGAGGHIVASEPLDACPEAWQSVPASSWVRVDAAGVTLHS